MTLTALYLYHFHRYVQCLCMAEAKRHWEQGDEVMATLELLHWADAKDEADYLYVQVKPHHERLYCESRGYALYL
jgi:hypothetical protein